MTAPISLIPGLMPEEVNTCKSINKIKEVVEISETYTEDTDSEHIVVTTGNDVSESPEVSVDELVRSYSLKQLRDMCNKQGLSNVGNKRDLAERVKANVSDLNDE